jgi:hypothetical protein
MKRVHAYDAPPTRASFRAELRERLSELGYDELLRAAPALDRAAARWAWVRYPRADVGRRQVAARGRGDRHRRRRGVEGAR